MTAGILLGLGIIFGQDRTAEVARELAKAPRVVAEIPVNYDEAAVGSYVLPAVLQMSNGAVVRDAKTWDAKRRPELIRLYEENQFGHAPKRPRLTHEVFERGAVAFEGKAVRRQLTIWFTEDAKGPKADVVVYLPPEAEGPVPVILNISFSPNAAVFNDPGVKMGEVWNREHKRVPATAGVGIGKLDPLPWVEKGIAFASVYYGDIEPDFEGGGEFGVRGKYAGDWGAIAAWAWGISNIIDYFEWDHTFDAKKIGVIGVSRLGKTVLWAGATDPRIALVIASCSGEGGAALGRRNYGETLKHMAKRYGYQFGGRYASFGDRVAEWPVDSHFLISLMAPRALLLQTGDTDFWSDPRGEYLGAMAAAPVFRLLGAKVELPAAMPAAGEAYYGSLGYYMHAGGHGTLAGDWPVFLKFVEKHFH